MSLDLCGTRMRIIETSAIDHTKGSTHKRFKSGTYPVDNGLFRGITSIDLGEVDLWLGFMGENKVVGALCTIALFMRTTELKKTL
jgi:hypothetical protein